MPEPTKTIFAKTEDGSHPAYINISADGSGAAVWFRCRSGDTGLLQLNRNDCYDLLIALQTHLVHQESPHGPSRQD